MKKFLNKKFIMQAISYALIGTSNFIIDITIVNLLMYIFNIYKGYPLIIFNFISFLVFSMNGYLLNKKFTFKSKNNSYLKYIAVLGTSVALNSVIFTFLSLFNIFNLNKILWANLSKIIASMSSGIICFLVNKFFVFN